MTSLPCTWPCPTDQPRLDPDAVHIWCLPLELAAAQIEELSKCLSDDERTRAARFRFDRHRRRFIACRGQVRGILAGYLNDRADRLQFRYGAKGKPALDACRRGPAIEFNVSNSHEMALCAVAFDCELGVDVEHMHRARDFDGLAARFFAGREVDRLRSLPTERRVEAFFNCWTRKEAVLKALGTGLTFPLDRVVVTLAPDEPARVEAFDDDTTATADWWLDSFEPAPGYVGALAARGKPLAVRRWLAMPADVRD
jgi:4'-phosphopantetheinyl transferase